MFLDKICDQISDAVLDAHLKQDPDAKVACGKMPLCMLLNLIFPSYLHIYIPFLYAETVAKTGMILLAGEVTSHASVDYQKVVRDTIRQIGYDDSCKGLFVVLNVLCLWARSKNIVFN